MLSPEAELRALVRSLEEPDDPAGGDHLSLSEVRAKIALGIRATLDCEGIREEYAKEPIRLALFDLDRGSKQRSSL